MTNDRVNPKRIMMIAPTPFFADRGCHVRILGEAKALLALAFMTWGVATTDEKGEAEG